jgi:hypothetical protein
MIRIISTALVIAMLGVVAAGLGAAAFIAVELVFAGGDQ